MRQCYFNFPNLKSIFTIFVQYIFNRKAVYKLHAIITILRKDINCKLPTGNPISYCLLPIANCQLTIAHCLLLIAHCKFQLPIAHCLLPIVNCQLTDFWTIWTLIFKLRNFRYTQCIFMEAQQRSPDYQENWL